MSWWVKADKEVKGLQSLTTSLEKERNELLEINKQLEAKQREQANRIEELDDEVWMEREEAEKALNAATQWENS